MTNTHDKNCGCDLSHNVLGVLYRVFSKSDKHTQRNFFKVFCLELKALQQYLQTKHPAIVCMHENLQVKLSIIAQAEQN